MSFYQYAAQVLNAVTLVTTGETAVVTTPQPSQSVAVEKGILLDGFVNVTAGTGATAVTVRIRAGSGVAGTVLLSTTHTLAAAASANIPLNFVDLTSAVVGQYTITVQQTAATGNGSATGMASISPVEGT